MELIGEVVAWLTDPANWTGRDAIPLRMGEHVAMSGFSLFVGLAVALPWAWPSVTPAGSPAPWWP